MKYSEYNEGKRHGTLDFPLEYYRLTPEHPQYVMKPHWHKELEIIRVVSGTFQLQLNGAPHALTAGDIVFVDGGTLHSGEARSGEYECVVFDPTMLYRKKDKVASYLAPFADGRYGFRNLRPAGDSGVYAAAERLFEAAKTPREFYELELYGILYALFCEACKAGLAAPAKEQRQTLKKNHTVIRLLDWIDENYADHITLQKLAQVAGLSEKYVCRIFKEYTFQTPMEYINERRLDAACQEMLSHRKSVTDAALACGFNDVSYFSKRFKQYKKMTPQVYKNGGWQHP